MSLWEVLKLPLLFSRFTAHLRTLSRGTASSLRRRYHNTRDSTAATVSSDGIQYDISQSLLSSLLVLMCNVWCKCACLYSETQGAPEARINSGDCSSGEQTHGQLQD